MTEASWIEASLMAVRMMAMRLKMMSLEKKFIKTSKFKNLSKSKKIIRSLDFLIPKTKLAFTKLRQAFLKAPIFHHFNSEYHIQIETDVLGYTISRVFSQLTLDNSGR